MDSTRLDAVAELLVLVQMVKGDEFYIKRIKKLLYYLMAHESYDYNQKTHGK
jgi:hypothetical protein